MTELLLHEDGLYRYSFVRGDNYTKNHILIELYSDDPAERDKIEILEKAPISDMDFFKQKLMDNGICDENILNNFVISLCALFENCVNLKNIAVLRDFDFTNVGYYNYMFSCCASLNDALCGFRILDDPLIYDQMFTQKSLCGGMFDGALQYACPSGFGNDLRCYLGFE